MFIQSVDIMPQAYKITLSQPVTGWFLAGSGHLEAAKPLWITQSESPVDFERLTKWINQNAKEE
jgi:hypothetical protein